MTEALRIPRDLVEEMVQHCEEGRPNEACGLLASSSGSVTKVLRMSNAAASPMRYALDPKEQFAAYRLIEDERLALAGVFHSHTHTEAYPSPTDVRLASEEVPYVIVSLATAPAKVRAFLINKESWTAETGEIVEIPVEIDG